MQSQSVHPFTQITCIPPVSKDVLCSTWAPLLVPVLLRSFLHRLKLGSESKDRGDSGMEIVTADQNGIPICLMFRGSNAVMGSG
jgi:hypothetical protein